MGEWGYLMDTSKLFEKNNQLNDSEIKQISLEILLEVDKFCRNHSIRYFLSYGTLLGAIRHQGFIPWDDDIDIVMPREDYEKFIALYSSEENSKYKIVTMETDAYYHLPFMKLMDPSTLKVEAIDNYSDVRGIEIDIFPLDGLSDNYSKACKQLRKTQLILKLRNLSLYKGHGSKNLFTFSFKLFFTKYCKYRGFKYWLKKAEVIAKKYKFNQCEYVGNISTLDYGNRQIFKKEFFLDSVDVIFEGHYFKAPKEYKYILEQLYGNYMELPPIDKQVSHHDFYSIKI